MPAHIIRITETKSPHFMEREPRYAVSLNGEKAGELYYNMNGYVGTLPTVQGSQMNIGERSISAWKKEATILNREAAQAISRGESDPRRIALTRPTTDNRLVMAISQVGEGDARAHILSRREYIRAVELFGRPDVGLGFFGEDGFSPAGKDMPVVLLSKGDEWMRGAIPDGHARMMDMIEAEKHAQAVHKVFETDDPEIRVVIGQDPSGPADLEPYFVTRLSLDFGRKILGQHLRVGDLSPAAEVSISDPAARQELKALFDWFNLNGESPIERQMREHERIQDAITAGHRLAEQQGEPLDAAQRHEVEQWKLTGPEI